MNKYRSFYCLNVHIKSSFFLIRRKLQSFCIILSSDKRYKNAPDLFLQSLFSIYCSQHRAAIYTSNAENALISLEQQFKRLPVILSHPGYEKTKIKKKKNNRNPVVLIWFVFFDSTI